MCKIFNFQFSIFKSQKGQALLIVVLIMVVALTVGLSVASRTITNIRTSSEEEASQRAFSAAEAGIEAALQSKSAISEPQPLPNNASIDSVSVDAISGTEFLINGANPIPQDDGVDIWLSNYPYYTNPWSGQLSIYWGNSSDVCQTTGNTLSALEIIVVSGSKATPVTTRYAFDPCVSGRRGVNNFVSPNGSAGIVRDIRGASKSFPYSQTITISSGLIARIVPLYANTPIGVKATTDLPPQGSVLESLGVAGAKGTTGSTQRKIRVYQGYPRVPSEFFQYTYFQPS